MRVRKEIHSECGVEVKYVGDPDDAVCYCPQCERVVEGDTMIVESDEDLGQGII